MMEKLRNNKWPKIGLLLVAGLLLAGGLVWAGIQMAKFQNQILKSQNLTPTLPPAVTSQPTFPSESILSPTLRPSPTLILKPTIILTPVPTKIKIEKIEVKWFLDDYDKPASMAESEKGIVVPSAHYLKTRIDVYGIGDAETKQIRYQLDGSGWIGLDVYNTEYGFFSLIWPGASPNSIQRNFGELSSGYHKIRIEVETRDGQIFSEEKTFYLENPSIW
jgi:hypothetical protein